MAQNNPQAVIDLAFRSTHVARSGRKGDRRTLLQLTCRRSRTSWVARAGGREAMMEAQTLPLGFRRASFAGAHSLAPSRNVMDCVVGQSPNDRPDSVVPALGKSQLDLVHQSVIEKCDLNDGVKDGLMGTRAAVTSIPQRSCGGAGRKGQCLTAQQVALVKKIYGSPMNSSGVPLSLPFAMKGTEHYWLDWFAGPSYL